MNRVLFLIFAVMAIIVAIGVVLKLAALALAAVVVGVVVMWAVRKLRGPSGAP